MGISADGQPLAAVRGAVGERRFASGDSGTRCGSDRGDGIGCGSCRVGWKGSALYGGGGRRWGVGRGRVNFKRGGAGGGGGGFVFFQSRGGRVRDAGGSRQ